MIGKGPDLQKVSKGADRSVLEFFTSVIAGVRYADWDQQLTVEEFVRLRDLAMMDQWTQKTNADLAEAFGCSERLITSLRASPEYQAMKHELLESAATVRKIRNARDYVDDPTVQDRVMRRLLHLIESHDLKVSERALQQFMDRAAPPVVRHQEERTVVVRIEDARTLSETEQMLLERGDFVDVTPEVESA